jgi:hypothetical protein
MKKLSFLILACGMATGIYTPASAQLNIDCGNVQNAGSYYCMNRGQFQGGSPPMAVEGRRAVPAEPMTTGSIADPRPPALNIDCGTPQNAITYNCMHRNEFR